MPRNASGIYTLPASNPVVSNTPIETSWANPTLADIGAEITNSLDRQGRGGMLVPFKNIDGTVALPGMTFTNEPGMGFFRASAGDMQATIAGVPQMRWQSSGVSVWTGSAWAKILSADAIAPVLISTPAANVNGLRIRGFAGQVNSLLDVEDDTGATKFMSLGPASWRMAVDTLGLFAGSGQTSSAGMVLQGQASLAVNLPTLEVRHVASGTSDIFKISSAGGSSAYWRFLADTLRGPNGLATRPAYSFANDQDTGMYLPSAGLLGLAVGGALGLSIGTTTVRSYLQSTTVSGDAAKPGWAFSSAANAGMFLSGTTGIGFATQGVERVLISDTVQFRSTVNWRGPGGNAAAPSISFSTDANTGFYSAGNGLIGVAIDGAERFRFASGSLTLPGAPTADLHAATKKYVDDKPVSGFSSAQTRQLSIGTSALGTIQEVSVAVNGAKAGRPVIVVKSSVEQKDAGLNARCEVDGTVIVSIQCGDPGGFSPGNFVVVIYYALS